MHEHIRDVCRRLAKQGYMAIAPELYVRQGSVAEMTDVQEIIAKVVSKVPDAQVMSDLDATVAYAKASGHGDTEKLGITGFCWGGRITWLYAAHSAQVQGRRRLVRKARRRQLSEHAAPPRRCRGRAQGAGARPLRRGRPGHPGRNHRSHARGVQSRRQDNARSSSTRTRRTPSMPTTARAIGRRRRRTGGRACSPGSAPMASPEQFCNRSVITER